MTTLHVKKILKFRLHVCVCEVAWAKGTFGLTKTLKENTEKYTTQKTQRNKYYLFGTVYTQQHIKAFFDDWDMDFIEECVHFQEFMKEVAAKKHSREECLKIIGSRELVATFPKVNTISCLFCTNAS